MTIRPWVALTPSECVSVISMQQRDHLLAALGDAEFGRLLQRVGGVAAGIGEPDHLGLGGLRLQQEGGEVGRVQGVTDVAQHLAAALLDDIGGIAFQRHAEGVVGGDEEPGVLAALDHRLAGDVGQRIGVVGPVHGVGRAGDAGDVGAAAAGIDVDLVLLAGQRGDRQRDRGGRHVEDRVDLLVVVPVAGDVDADVGLVLVVGGDHLDRLALHLAAVVGDRHLDRGQRALAGRVGIEARHVGEHADLDDVVGNLRARRSAGHGEGEAGHHVAASDFMVSSPWFLLRLVEPCSTRLQAARKAEGGGRNAAAAD